MYLSIPLSRGGALEAVPSLSLLFPFLFPFPPLLFLVFTHHSTLCCARTPWGHLWTDTHAYVCLGAAQGCPSVMGGAIKSPTPWSFLALLPPCCFFEPPCHPFGCCLIVQPLRCPSSCLPSPPLPIFFLIFLSLSRYANLYPFFSFFMHAHDYLHVKSLIKHVSN